VISFIKTRGRKRQDKEKDQFSLLLENNESIYAYLISPSADMTEKKFASEKFLAAASVML